MRIRAVLFAAVIGAALLVPSVPVGAATATPVESIPRVGAIFFPALPGLTQLLGLPHECSAAVVHSASRNLVLTAAHCIVGTGLGYGVAPGYHDGAFPYGLWTVRRVYVNNAWLQGHDPQHDYAFLALAPRTSAGIARNVEDVVGGYPLGSAPAVGTSVTVDGYVAGARDRPLTCTVPTYRTAGFPSIDCAGFADGTSGGPWLRSGAVVGLIGGLHQGGCLDSTSYSPAFGADIAADLARAASGAHGDLVSLPGSAGCG